MSTFTRVPQWVSDRYKPKGSVDVTPFRVWDGEGITPEGETVQNLVLWGWHQEREMDVFEHHKVLAHSLTTKQCFEFMLSTVGDKVYNVGYGLTYDIDQILKDVKPARLIELHRDNWTRWEGFTIHYIPGKIFQLYRHGTPRFLLHDTISFFRTSFLGACSQYLPEWETDIDAIRNGKQSRNTFTYAELYSLIVPYWEREGSLGVRLMDALRSSLRGGGIKLSKWYGPGAIANSLLTTNKLSTHIVSTWDDTPDPVKLATRHAYFAGRFDNRKIGRIPGPIYGYDIRSAYPAALAQMPGLMDGQWVHTIKPEIPKPWGLYRYMGKAKTDMPYGLFPFRSDLNDVTFALWGYGWLYGHELIAAWPYANIELFEGWEWVPNGEVTNPFQFLREMYLLRAHYKDIGNPAQYGLKLGYNSIYGKLAQLVGFDPETLRPPRFHHQWYAGQTTSWCRGQIMAAMLQQPGATISIETDGIYTREPLKLPVGEWLGGWEATTYDEMIYVQSGLYFARKGDEWLSAKSRGLGTIAVGRELTPENVIPNVDMLTPLETTVVRYGTFTGHLGRKELHTWYESPRKIMWGGDGKRVHLADLGCPGCNGQTPWHNAELVNPYPIEFSHPRKLPWLES